MKPRRRYRDYARIFYQVPKPPDLDAAPLTEERKRLSLSPETSAALLSLLCSDFTSRLYTIQEGKEFWGIA